MKKDYLAKRG